MPTKNRTLTTSSVQTKTIKRPSTRVVNAVVFSTPDLSFYLKLQNLLNYFVDCMNSLTSPTDNNPETAEHLTRCIKHINDLHVSGITTFDDEIQITLNEFLEDAHQFEHLVASFARPQQGSPLPSDKSAAVLLAAKASHLQWLSVCILEDLKKTHSPG
jgi:hypothetical protein